ncbi:MAG TPA: glutamate synthase subunit beta, partial [Vicinamibacterales bacterium]|nr:glutamate synthase subunit beta [Vicinamibacterales bacterium]
RICPAPCEAACVLSIGDAPVTIKGTEAAIVDRAFDEGWMASRPPTWRTGKHVAIVGSGPAGLATADQLNRAGHSITVFERSDRIGGLLRYGIPEFKLEKRLLERRLSLMQAEGVVFRPGCTVGIDITADDLLSDFDAVVLAGGSTRPRDLRVPGRELRGIHFAMDFLTAQNRRCEGDELPADENITAEGKQVVIIGGGDTGADCLGTVLRQGAAAVRQLELLPRPPDSRADDNPWPEWPQIFRVSTAHEEGGERLYSVLTERFIGDADGAVATLQAVRVERRTANGRTTFEPVPDSRFDLPADLVLLAMGFTGPERSGLLEQFGVQMTERGTVWRDPNWMTSVPAVFTAGDMQRGQSLIVWAIAEGRSCARGVDLFLMGESDLPAPV